MHHVMGDMQVASDGTVDGWCWSPQRPTERLTVDILIDEYVVVSGDADTFRVDLEAAGIGDGRHAFVLRLPQGALGSGASCLVSARERVSLTVFGRRLHEPPPGPEEPWVTALRAELDAAASALSAMPRRDRTSGLPSRLRQAAGELAVILRAPDPVAAARALLARHPTTDLSAQADPATSLVVWAADAASAQRTLQAVAPAAQRLRAEVLLCQPGQDARMVLLASVTPGLVLALTPAASAVSALAAAAPQALAPWLLLADPEATGLSASGIADLLGRLDAADLGFAITQGLAATAPGSPRRLAAVTRLGLLAAVRPALLADADPAASDPVASLAHLAGRQTGWALVDEPWAAFA
jgi:hypothetical protein